jgi:hypothetical protein
MRNSKVHLRSSLQSLPDELISPFDRIVHDQGLSTSAASGGLEPLPIKRLRWAYHHLLYSIATRAFLTHRGLPSSFIQHRALLHVLDTSGAGTITRLGRRNGLFGSGSAGLGFCAMRTGRHAHQRGAPALAAIASYRIGRLVQRLIGALARRRVRRSRRHEPGVHRVAQFTNKAY